MSDFIPSANTVRTRAGQAHHVSYIDETGFDAVDAVVDDPTPSSLWGEAWKNLRRRLIFWIAFAIIVIVLAISAFPSPFTSQDPRFCELPNSLKGPSNGHPLDLNRQGCDVYSRVIYGAHASVSVDVFTTTLVVLFDGVIGVAAGHLGGWFDALPSRITDISFAIPLLLVAIVFMQMFKDNRNIWMVITVLSLFGWTQIAGIMCGAVTSVKNEEFVAAVHATGAPKSRIFPSYIIPSSVVPIIAYATIALGTFIMSGASLSLMSIGLPPEVVSWGADISVVQVPLRTSPMVLSYPALVLALTVLSFIMMGDVVRDILDPRARK